TMIRRLARCLLYRKGVSERFARNHWATPSSTETQEGPPDSDFAESFKHKLLPSQQFRNGLSKLEKKRLQLLIKQTEMYCSIARKVPTTFSDEEWNRLLDLRSVSERVGHLEFIAVKARKVEMDQHKKNGGEIFGAHMQQQIERYNAGGMGYGPQLYELMANPLRRKERDNLVKGARVWSSLRLMDEHPTIVFDMQYVFDGQHDREHSIKKQLQFCITENLQSVRPLPLIISNVPDNENGKFYTENVLGFWGSEKQHQMILPDVEKVSPRAAVRKATGKKNPKIVYISRHARKVLDGPLDADAYVICASYDNNRESFIAAKNQKINAYRLPIQKYCNWQHGAHVLPLPNTMRLFRDLVQTGGDWS
ncbi:hypothetical protein PMAYCL1PPCAC_03826, partial [Pristionchus mayeri]